MERNFVKLGFCYIDIYLYFLDNENVFNDLFNGK